MAEQHQHLVYGKTAHTGAAIIYTDNNGIKHEAVVKNLEPVYHADIQTQLEGTSRFLQHIPFNEGGAPGTWSHNSEEPEAAQEAASKAASVGEKQSKPTSKQ